MYSISTLYLLYSVQVSSEVSGSASGHCHDVVRGMGCLYFQLLGMQYCCLADQTIHSCNTKAMVPKAGLTQVSTLSLNFEVVDFPCFRK